MQKLRAYNYEQNFLDHLHLFPEDGSHFLNYNGLNFLAKIRPENHNILFSFHGAVWEPETEIGSGTNRIVFRGYEYTIEKTDIICLCDYLLNKYEEFIFNWTLPTKKYDTENIYSSLISHILSIKNYEKILFSGTSAGGYPSIKYASIFSQTALVSNSQLYLEHYTGFNHLKNIASKHGDEVIYEPRNIEKHILENHPKKIILYNNILDSTFKRDIIPFLDFISEKELFHIIDPYFFISREKPIPPQTQHHILFPNKIKHIDVLKAYFNGPS